MGGKQENMPGNAHTSTRPLTHTQKKSYWLEATAALGQIKWEERGDGGEALGGRRMEGKGGNDWLVREDGTRNSTVRGMHHRLLHFYWNCVQKVGWGTFAESTNLRPGFKTDPCAKAAQTKSLQQENSKRVASPASIHHRFPSLFNVEHSFQHIPSHLSRL